MGREAYYGKSERKSKPKIAIELKPIVKPGIWNFENQLLKKKLLFQIPFVRDRTTDLVGRNNRHLIPTHLWSLLLFRMFS